MFFLLHLLKFFRPCRRQGLVSQPDAYVKNSDTLWRYRKKFRRPV